VFKVFSPQTFDTNNTAQVEAIREGLQAVIRLGFECLNGSSNPQCLATSRRKRQVTCTGYTVNIIQPITTVNKQRKSYI
jgi:hypothetical protein